MCVRIERELYCRVYTTVYNTLYVEVFCVDTKAQGVSQAVSRICVEKKKQKEGKKNTDKERKTTVMQPNQQARSRGQTGKINTNISGRIGVRF